jgi:uncharacterized protein (DUF1499 family)
VLRAEGLKKGRGPGAVWRRERREPRTYPFGAAALVLVAVLGGCASPPTPAGDSVQADEASLACALPTNCVASSEGSAHPPLRYAGPPERAVALLHAALDAFPEARIVEEDGARLTAIFTTPAGFRDRVDFRVDAARQRIDYRSQSTFGLFDFGKNRSRMTAFAARFAALAGPPR